MKSCILHFFLLLVLPLKNVANAQANVTTISIDPEITFQTIHNFGASDAWSSQYVGNWPDSLRNRVADLLFSTAEKKDGSFTGIGLSCWRYNIGAGSAQQSGETKIGDPWRRTECFMQADGSFDWQKQSGQKWFLQAAKTHGVEQFIAFSNSPPVWMTKNGRANSDGGNSSNLATANYNQFVDFLVKTIQYFHKEEGIKFDFVSPVNEPQWDWKDGQEGSPWTNVEIAKLCRILGSELDRVHLKTKIQIAEAGLLTHLFDRGNDYERGFQIKTFFLPGSENYVGDVPNMARMISGHSYFTVKNDSVLNDARQKLFHELKMVNPSPEYWMTEFCILGGNGILKGGGRDLGMETALFVAGVIHADLTVANASAWQWWLAVSPYNFKDGLVYIDKSETGGKIYESKLLWGLGNWSVFVRPGAKRIMAESTGNPNLKISAFKNKNGAVAVVVINAGTENQNIKMNLQAGKGKMIKVYETSGTKSLERVSVSTSDGLLNLPPKSISTVLIDR